MITHIDNTNYNSNNNINNNDGDDCRDNKFYTILLQIFFLHGYSSTYIIKYIMQVLA